MWYFCSLLVTKLTVKRIKLEEFQNIAQETDEFGQMKATATVGMSQFYTLSFGTTVPL